MYRCTSAYVQAARSWRTEGEAKQNLPSARRRWHLMMRRRHHTSPERDALLDGGRGATLATALCAQKVREGKQESKQSRESNDDGGGDARKARRRMEYK